MKCPYNRKSETRIQGFSQRLGEDEEKASGVQIDHWEFQLADCLKEECGAWHNDRCCYNSSK